MMLAYVGGNDILLRCCLSTFYTRMIIMLGNAIIIQSVALVDAHPVKLELIRLAAHGRLLS